MSGAHVLVIAGGDAPTAANLAVLLPADHVIAADSGYDHARRYGVTVDVVVGDLDSITGGGRRAAVAAGIPLVEHPRDKDQTDLELALALALAHPAGRITVLGGHGGRLDHLLANVLLLASPALAAVEVEALLGPARVTVIRSTATLRGRVGELVSLLPVHGDAGGVTTQGLRYPLRGETLRAGSPRGVSNDFVAPEASVTVASGTLVAVQPEAFL